MRRRPFARRPAIAALVALALAIPALGAPAAGASAGVVEIEGSGWGHGVGMSQWGARGQAEAGRNHRQILQHYYTGVSVDTVGLPGTPGDVRVQVASTDGAVTVRPPSGTSVSVRLGGGEVRKGAAGANVRVEASGNRFRVVTGGSASTHGSPGSTLVLDWGSGGPVTVTPPDRQYRHGRLHVVLDANRSPCTHRLCVVVARMSAQQYLYGIGEMPSSWPVEALKAQAVAARSFAAGRLASPRARYGNGTVMFHLVSSVSDQAYVGWSKEAESSGGTCWGCRWRNAVNATNGQVIRSGSQILSANYSASSGGHTEDAAYVWGGGASHLRARSDPWDRIPANPHRSWKRSFTLRELGSWFGVPDLVDVRITGSIGVSGRVDRATVRLVGRSSTKQVTGNQFRATINARVPWSRQIMSTRFRITAAGFPDVPPAAFYTEGVRWLVEHGITTGVGNTGRYEPNRSVTRGEMAAFIWRFMDRPSGAPAPGFVDVPPRAFYRDPVAWMRHRGITTGVDGTNRYQPMRAVTRAEMAALLWRLVGSPAVGAGHGFVDVPAGSYFAPAVRWLRANGITTGIGGSNRYDPHGLVTRGQMAAFLHRLAQRPAAWGSTSPPSTVAF